MGDDKSKNLLKVFQEFLAGLQNNKTYNYQQNKSGGRRTLTIVAVLIIMVLGFSLATSWTGNIIYAGGLESRIGGLEENLANCQKNVDSLTGEKKQLSEELAKKTEKISGLETDLLNTQNNLLDCSDQRENLRQQTDDQADQIANLEGDLSTEKNNYKGLVRNTVRGVCCSVSDIISKKTRTFNVDSNQIFCADEGDFEVNCGTGETDY